MKIAHTMPLPPSSLPYDPDLVKQIAMSPIKAVTFGATGVHPFDLGKRPYGRPPRLRAVAVVFMSPMGECQWVHLDLEGWSLAERGALATALLQGNLVAEDALRTMIWLRAQQRDAGMEMTWPEYYLCALQIARLTAPALPSWLHRCAATGTDPEHEWLNQRILAAEDKHAAFDFGLDCIHKGFHYPIAGHVESEYVWGRYGDWAKEDISGKDAFPRLATLIAFVGRALENQWAQKEPVEDPDTWLSEALGNLMSAALCGSLTAPHLSLYQTTMEPALRQLVHEHERGQGISLNVAYENFKTWSTDLMRSVETLINQPWGASLRPFIRDLQKPQTTSSAAFDTAFFEAIKTLDPEAKKPVNASGSLSLSKDAVRLCGLHRGKTAEAIQLLEHINRLKYLLSANVSITRAAVASALCSAPLQRQWGAPRVDTATVANFSPDELRGTPSPDLIPDNPDSLWIQHAAWREHVAQGGTDPLGSQREAMLISALASGYEPPKRKRLYYSAHNRIFHNLELTRVHPLFSPTAKTDRTITTAPTTQNEPNDDLYRSQPMPCPGFVRIELDYSQQELRGVAALALRAQEEIWAAISNAEHKEATPIGVKCVTIVKAIFQETDASLLTSKLPAWIARIKDWAIALHNFSHWDDKRPCRIHDDLIPKSYQGIKDELDLCRLRVAAIRVRLQQLEQGKRYISPLAECFRQGMDVHLITGLMLAQQKGLFQENPFDVVAKAVQVGAQDQLAQEWRTERKQAKPVNFGLIYGLTPESLHKKGITDYDLDWGLDLAEKAEDGWFESFPEVALWQAWTVLRPTWEGPYAKYQFNRRTKTKEVVTRTQRLWGVRALQGRFYVCDGWREALNFQNQGTAAHMFYDTVRLLPEFVRIGIVQRIHDEIKIEAPLEQKEHVTRIAKNAMILAGDDALGKYGIPTTVDIEIVENAASPANLPPPSEEWLAQISWECPTFARVKEKELSDDLACEMIGVTKEIAPADVVEVIKEEAPIASSFPVFDFSGGAAIGGY